MNPLGTVEPDHHRSFCSSGFLSTCRVAGHKLGARGYKLSQIGREVTFYGSVALTL